MFIMLSNITTATQDLSLRMPHAENKISDICHACNNLIDVFIDHDTEIQKINANTADLEEEHATTISCSEAFHSFLTS